MGGLGVVGVSKSFSFLRPFSASKAHRAGLYHLMLYKWSVCDFNTSTVQNVFRNKREKCLDRSFFFFFLKKKEN